MRRTNPDPAGSDQQGLLYTSDLVRNARRMGPYRFSCTESGSKPVLEGALSTRFMQPGLSLHTMDARIVQPFRFETRLEPCLKVAVVLNGHTRVTYGDRQLDLGPGMDRGLPAGALAGSVIALNREESCILGDPQCGVRRSLTLTLAPEWLARQQLDRSATRQFLDQHLRMTEWRLPAPLGLMAQQLFAYPDDGPAGQLMREGFALTLAGGLVEHLERGELAPAREPLPGRRGQQLLELLHSGEADQLSVGEIGDRLGMSIATLQRHSRKLLGTSLNVWLRQRRLKKAQNALQRGEVSVAEAALLAGYGHAANFATAFKREFGICPGSVARGGRRES